MADAFVFAEGGPPSREIRLLQQIDRFGIAAVLGRKLYAREIYRMRVAENIVNAYRAQEATNNVAVWASENRQSAKLLNRARRLKQELYGDE